MSDKRPRRMSDACKKNLLHFNDRQIRKGMEECLESITSVRRLLLGLKLEAFADYRPIEEQCYVLLQTVNDRICRLDDPRLSAEATEIVCRLKELATDDRGKGHFNTEADWMAAVGDVNRLERICTDALEAISSRA